MDPQQFGKYRLLRHLASGGMAELFVAEPLDGSGTQLVIKRIRPEHRERTEFRNMFLEEGRINAAIHHQNVVAVFDSGEVDGLPYLGLEYVDGLDLRGLLHAVALRGARLPLAISVHIILEVALGLHAAHTVTDSQGLPLRLVHRDVCPHNILISFQGQVKISDFGIAHGTDAQTNRPGQLTGRAGYLSPEQCDGLNIDHRTDIFSLGIVLYECTVGRRLFKGPSRIETQQMIRDAQIAPPSTIVPDYPADLERIVMRALARDPDDRYTTAEGLARDLSLFLAQTGQDLDERFLADYVRNVTQPARESGWALPAGGAPTAAAHQGDEEPITPIVAEEPSQPATAPTEVPAAPAIAAPVESTATPVPTTLPPGLPSGTPNSSGGTTGGATLPPLPATPQAPLPASPVPAVSAALSHPLASVPAEPPRVSPAPSPRSALPVPEPAPRVATPAPAPAAAAASPIPPLPRPEPAPGPASPPPLVTGARAGAPPPLANLVAPAGGKAPPALPSAPAQPVPEVLVSQEDLRGGGARTLSPALPMAPQPAAPQLPPVSPLRPPPPEPEPPAPVRPESRSVSQPDSALVPATGPQKAVSALHAIPTLARGGSEDLYFKRHMAAELTGPRWHRPALIIGVLVLAAIVGYLVIQRAVEPVKVVVPSKGTAGPPVLQPQAADATLVVETNPSNASVELDLGREAVPGKATFQVVSGRSHTLLIQQRGFHTHQSRFFIEPGGSHTETVTLLPLESEPLMGKVIIDSRPTRIPVFRGMDQIGLTPGPFSLPAGEDHLLRFRPEGFVPQTCLVTPRAGLENLVRLDLASMKENSGEQELRVRSRPERAKVFINGKKLGETPFFDRYPRGVVVTVRLEKDGFAAWERDVHLDGYNVQIEAELEAKRVAEAQLKLSANVPLKAYLDSNELPKLPQTITLPVGNHELVVETIPRAKDQKPIRASFRIQLEPGEILQRRVIFDENGNYNLE